MRDIPLEKHFKHLVLCDTLLPYSWKNPTGLIACEDCYPYLIQTYIDIENDIQTQIDEQEKELKRIRREKENEQRLQKQQKILKRESDRRANRILIKLGKQFDNWYTNYSHLPISIKDTIGNILLLRLIDNNLINCLPYEILQQEIIPYIVLHMIFPNKN